jgi:hypothetical protein
MPWLYSNTNYPSTPASYEWRGTNLYNQHCAAIGSVPANAAVTQLRVYAAGRNNAVSTYLCLWSAGSSIIRYSSQFSMAVGTESGGGQDWHTKSITPIKVSGGTYWVGLYRNPSGGHIFGRPTSPGANAYQKTNTSSFPSIGSMSGYNIDSGDEVTVGLFYITAPDDPTSASVARTSDTRHTISWTRNASSDKPVYNQYVQRYDNVSGTWTTIATITTDYTSNGSQSYTDTTTVANKRYRYRIYANNTSGNSGYEYTDYIRTTPAVPTSVVATRVGTTVEITWNDNATAETNQTIQRKTSTDNVTWSSYSTLSSAIAANTEIYTDSSPANYNKYQVRADCTDPTLNSSYVESNVVIIIQPPDAPSGLTPTDSTAIDGDNANTFNWTHNPNDGTDQSKFSLKIKKSGGIYPKEIDNFSNYSEWTASGCDIADDTTNKVTGLASSVSINDSDDTGSTVSIYKTVSSLDLTAFDDESASDTSDLIVLLAYCSDVSLFSDLTLKIGTDASNYYYTSVDPSADWSNGWNTIAVAKSAFDTASSPTGWDDIDYIRIDITTENNASAENISVQYLQLAKVTDFTSYAGDLFVQYHEIESVTESLSLIAESLQNGYSFDWQVKTWGQATTGGTYSDGSSDWSDTSTFVASTTPVSTITDPTEVSNYAYSSLEVDWDYTQLDSSNQVEYICSLYDSSDTLLETQTESTDVSNGGSDTATFTTALENNTTYTIILLVKSAAGLWSEENEVEFTTEFLEPTTPVITLLEDSDIGGVNISITNPAIEVVYPVSSSQDTYVNSTYSSANYNDNGQLDLIDDTGGGTDKSVILLDFDLSEFSGDTIVSADLYLYRKYALTPGIDSAVNYIKTAFVESTVTYATIPTLDTTDYDDHTHSAGDSEVWDIASLITDICDGSISDYEGIAVVSTTTDGSADYFYDSTVENYEPELIIEISPRNAETASNNVYRSVAGGEWELVSGNIPANTTITDYIPNIGGNTNYYAEAVSALPSSKNSAEVDIDINHTGYYYINCGDNYGDYAKLRGDTSISESFGRETKLKKYHGREYSVKYQGENKSQIIIFSCDLPKENFETVKNIIEAIGNHFYRSYEGDHFQCAITNPNKKDKVNEAYQLSFYIERVDSSG